MVKQAVKFSDMTDDQLIGEAKALYESIYITDCYGVKDMLYLDAITQELTRRGYQSVERTTLTFQKRSRK